jgi:hypothetical protein
MVVALEHILGGGNGIERHLGKGKSKSCLEGKGLVFVGLRFGYGKKDISIFVYNRGGSGFFCLLFL